MCKELGITMPVSKKGELLLLPKFWAEKMIFHPCLKLDHHLSIFFALVNLNLINT